MKFELITKVADLIIKTGILTTLAIGTHKYFEKLPKATPAPVYYTTPSEDEDDSEDEEE